LLCPWTPLGALPPDPRYRLALPRSPYLGAPLKFVLAPLGLQFWRRCWSEVYRRWDDGFLVRRMRREDVTQVIKWFESSWAVTVDLEVAFEMRGDKDAFCIGELNGETIASIVLTQVADDLSYRNYLYVVEQYRKRGFARRMSAVIHDIIDRRNCTEIVGLDAVSHAQSMFEKFGYKSAYNVIFYQGTAPANVDREFGTDIKLVKTVNLGLLLSLSCKLTYIRADKYYNF